MEEKKTVLEYISQVFMLYGIMITLELIFCMIFGEAAETYGTMFALGNQGLSVAVLVEFLVIAIIIVAIRALFFTTIIFRSEERRVVKECTSWFRFRWSP